MNTKKTACGSNQIDPRHQLSLGRFSIMQAAFLKEQICEDTTLIGG